MITKRISAMQDQVHRKQWLEQKEVSFPRFTLQGGGGVIETLTVTVSVDLHPFASVMVTMYVAVTVSHTMMDWVVSPLLQSIE